MLNKIKNRIEKEIALYIRSLDRTYSFGSLSPALFGHIKGLLSGNGKRIRPSFFVIGYLGFADKPAPGLYRSALSVELLHNFILVHDDIIDRSGMRRDKPSMHNMLDKYLKQYKNVKCSGRDLAIIIGDVIYALGISAFLSIDEDRYRKEAALKKFVDAAVHTGSGEFLELLSGAKDIAGIAKEDIYRIYDLKTGIYSFATPLVAGAILGGAKKEELDRLYKGGIYLGRAFQMNDDLSDIFDNEQHLAKDAFTDLREARRTILIWYAYNNSNKKERLLIKRILKKNNASHSDLLKVRKIIIDSGAPDYAKTQIASFTGKANALYAASKMDRVYKDALINYSNTLSFTNYIL